MFCITNNDQKMHIKCTWFFRVCLYHLIDLLFSPPWRRPDQSHDRCYDVLYCYHCLVNIFNYRMWQLATVQTFGLHIIFCIYPCFYASLLEIYVLCSKLVHIVGPVNTHILANMFSRNKAIVNPQYKVHFTALLDRICCRKMLRLSLVAFSTGLALEWEDHVHLECS